MVLFIDACARKDSRTRELALTLLNKIGDDYETLSLYESSINPINEKILGIRTEFCSRNMYDDTMFDLAKQFAVADKIVIAAPFWDLSFPAVLKNYIENICVVGLTFKYSQMGIPIGLCTANELYYVTTAGGKIYNSDYCFGYIESLSKNMFGIEKCELIKAEDLDIVGNDPKEIMEKAKNKILNE